MTWLFLQTQHSTLFIIFIVSRSSLVVSLTTFDVSVVFLTSLNTDIVFDVDVVTVVSVSKNVASLHRARNQTSGWNDYEKGFIFEYKSRNIQSIVKKTFSTLYKKIVNVFVGNGDIEQNWNILFKFKGLRPPIFSDSYNIFIFWWFNFVLFVQQDNYSTNLTFEDVNYIKFRSFQAKKYLQQLFLGGGASF